MVRDTRKNQAYFDSYIANQEKRIHKFQQILNQLIESGAEKRKRQQCCLYLENLCWDMLVAQYSCGSGKEILNQWFTQYCEYVLVQDTLTYNEALHVFSLAILLDRKDITVSASYPEDSFLDALKSYSESGTLLQADEIVLAFPEKFQEFFRCLQGELDAYELRAYIEERWYPSNSDMPWHDSDKRSRDTYCGYWCFTGAAVAKIRGFSPDQFNNCTYFPLDLLCS